MQSLEMIIWFWYWQHYQPLLGIKNAKQNMKGNIVLVDFGRISQQLQETMQNTQRTMILLKGVMD